MLGRLVTANRIRRVAQLGPTFVMLTSLVVACADGVTPIGPVASLPPPPPQGPSNPVPPPPTSPPARITGRVAFASDRSGSSWIYVADSISVRPLVPGDEPAWSPDGAMIAFESGNGIGIVNADGTNERTIRSRGSQPTWSPDGTQIAFTDGGIRVMQADGSGDRTLVAADFFQRDDVLGRPDWSADGQHIAFVRYDCCWMWPLEIYVVALDGIRPRLVMNGVRENGGTVYYSHWSPSWAPDGRSIAFIHNFDLVTMATGAGVLKYVGTRAAWESRVDWSPDGRRLVFGDYNGSRERRTPPFTGPLRIYVADVETGSVDRLIPEVDAPANLSYWDNNPAWSPSRR